MGDSPDWEGFLLRSCRRTTFDLSSLLKQFNRFNVDTNCSLGTVQNEGACRGKHHVNSAMAAMRKNGTNAVRAKEEDRV